MANTEIFLRNIFGTTRPNIRPLVLALNITNDLLFEQHISMSDIKATKHIYPDVARLLHKKPETVYKSVIRLAHRCWDALVEQDLVLSYLGRSMKQEPDPSVFITYLAVYIQSDIPFFEFIERDPGFLFRDSPDIFGMSDIPPESTTKLLLRNKPLLVSQAMAFTSPAGLTTFPVCPACMATLEREGQNFCDHCGQRLDWRWYKHAQIIYPGQKSALNILDKDVEQQDRLLLVTKWLYPDVARKYGTNWKAVERNIRTVSTIAWKHNLPLLESLSHRHLDRRLRSAEFLAVLFHAVCSDEFERPA